MQIVIAAEEVMAHGDYIVKRACRREEDYDECERENDYPVVPLHKYIDSGHFFAPDGPIMPPLRQRSCKSR